MTTLTDGENDGGLAAVALTIGEAKVKGTEGGEEGAGGSCRGGGGERNRLKMHHYGNINTARESEADP